MAQQLREMIDKWDYMKLKSFSQQMTWSLNWRGPPTDWEEIFGSYTSDKGLITRIHRELKKLNSQKVNKAMGKCIWIIKEKKRNGQMNWTELFQRKKST
jgi:hypothetical protein